jgi:hypothetical protein
MVEIILGQPPEVQLQPAGQYEVKRGQKFQLKCKVKGKPRPLITWFRNEQQVNETDHIAVTQ